MLNEDSHIPLYRQLNTLLLQKIESGGGPAATVCPPKRSFAGILGQPDDRPPGRGGALKQGAALPQTGQGDLCDQPQARTEVSSFYSFGDDMEREGHSLESRVLSFRAIPCPEPAAGGLGTPLVSRSMRWSGCAGRTAYPSRMRSPICPAPSVRA